MTTIDFLKALWPSEGLYCLYVPKVGRGHHNRTYDSVTEAAQAAVAFAAHIDVYFTIHTLKQRQVPHLTEPGKMQTRVQRNAQAARCFFFDIDIEAGHPEKYHDREQALAGLRAFVAATNLPKPMIVSSGGGFHIYWRLTSSLPSEEWRDHAARLRQLALHYGFKIDRSRTTDSASVLRPAGTYNRKDPANPRQVEVLYAGEETATGVFVKSINEAVIHSGEVPAAAPKLAQAETSLLGSNLDLEYDGPNPSISAAFEGCAQIKRIVQLQGKFSEPEWYRIAIGVGRFIEGGDMAAHMLSRGHPEYNRAACDAKIAQNKVSQKGPSSCASVAYASGAGDAPCQTCPLQGKVYGPIQAALWKDPAPPPIHVEQVGEVQVQITIPDPPKPFIRLKDGTGVAVVTKNADGTTEDVTKIYDYDLYPIRRLSNPTQGVEQQVWHVCLPNGEARDITFDADQVYDARKFVVTIANNGIYPSKGHIPHLQEYMVAYIAQLQKLAAADAQCNHLGWADDLTSFILPDKVLHTGGGITPAQLSIGAQRASAAVERKGTLERQVELLRFYAHPAYLANQFLILGGLGSPIFFATGHHGVVVNASGEAGASKSTSLYAAASFWGQPEMYPINGTNNGATVRGRNERVTTLANLPVCVDEITHMPAKDAVDLAMSVTQPGHRIRLQTDGVERASVGSYKATMMLTTANNSLHSVLSLDNAAGTAGSMRVVELMFRPAAVHQKFEADDFLHALKENYGHLGPVFMQHVITHLDAVKARVRQVQKEIDQEANIRSSERFWSATIAANLVAGEIAFKLGLLSFDIPTLRRWVIEHQVPFMRGVVSTEYSDPLSIVTDYLAQINGNIVIIGKGTGNISNVLSVPKTGALLGHYDIGEGMLYLLKKAFKEHCARIGANSTKIIGDLNVPRDGVPIVPQVDTRRVLGAGTDLAKGQSWCFAINMGHPAVSGIANLTVVQGGATGSVTGARPGLAAVQ